MSGKEPWRGTYYGEMSLKNCGITGLVVLTILETLLGDVEFSVFILVNYAIIIENIGILLLRGN